MTKQKANMTCNLSPPFQLSTSPLAYYTQHRHPNCMPLAGLALRCHTAVESAKLPQEPFLNFFPHFAWFLACITASMEVQSASSVSLPFELYVCIIHESS